MDNNFNEANLKDELIEPPSITNLETNMFLKCSKQKEHHSSIANIVLLKTRVVVEDRQFPPRLALPHYSLLSSLPTYQR